MPVRPNCNSQNPVIIENANGQYIIRRQDGVDLKALAEQFASEGFEYHSGIIGVPITFLDSYCPDQFEVLDMAHRGAGTYKYRTKIYTEDDAKNYSDLNATACYVLPDGTIKNGYFRMLIRRK